MGKIQFKTKLVKIGRWIIVRLPESASLKLSSRGMAVVEGTIDGLHFKAPLEPDGRGSHWFRFDESMHQATGADAGDTVTLAIEPVKEWPEPDVPADLEDALKADPGACDTWMKTTPNARWDWIRWIRSTKSLKTRRRRIEAARDKLKKGERRPCCFNRNACTEPEVSRSGILLEPEQKNRGNLEQS